MHTSPLLVALIHIGEAFPLFPSSLLPSKEFSLLLRMEEACLTLPPRTENMLSCIGALDKELHV